MNPKAVLRARLVEQAAAQGIDLQRRRQEGNLLRDAVVALSEVREAKGVALFVGVGHEPDTSPLFEALDPVPRWFPKVRGPASLGWAVVDDLEQLVEGAFGIRAPAQSQLDVLPASVDVVFVPGVAFDRGGRRLGWGRGYYDRALRHVPNAMRIGLCAPDRLLDEPVPVEDHDVPMHAVVTPREALRCPC